MKFSTPNYRGLRRPRDDRGGRGLPLHARLSGTGWIGSDLDRQLHENAERILLQSVAASTMSAHLAAGRPGLQRVVGDAIGQETAQEAMRPLLGVPEELLDIDRLFMLAPRCERRAFSCKSASPRWADSRSRCR